MAEIINTSGVRTKIHPKDNQFQLEELQKIVGGYIEIVWFRDGSDRIMVVNEEGKLNNLPMNMVATVEAWNGKAIKAHDCIVGNVLICSRDDVD